MAVFSNKQYTERPVLQQRTAYTTTPKYIKHQPYEDKLAILVCQIKIWQATAPNWFSVPAAGACLTIRECESIEISDSSKTLVNKAVVRFPRGTVINLSSRKTKPVKSGDKATDTEHTEGLAKTNNDGDLTTTPTAVYSDDNVSTTSMAIGYDDKGLLEFNRAKQDRALLSPHDVATGNRIEIRLGYAYSETEFKRMNSADADPNMPVVFTGFITSISADTPLELECTNMAHVLTCISPPNIPAKDSLTVNDFLDDQGKYHLLKDTGISLAESSKGCTINVRGGEITENLTVADVLERWQEAGVSCIMETKDNGRVELKVGYAYYAGSGGGSLPVSDPKYITYNGGVTQVTLIQFDWDVAEDKLSMKCVDKKYLAVEAKGKAGTDDKGNNKWMKLTVRKKADSDDEGWVTSDPSDFQTVNKRLPSAKKGGKATNGTKNPKKTGGRLINKVKMKEYMVIPYTSISPQVTEKQLIEEAKQYWGKYNPNGISGSIQIFGDLMVRPMDIVGLISPRQPEKNGYYLVESVNTTFGVNGYRRELKLPFKISSFAKPVEIIR